MAKLAYLILTHHKPQQVERLLQAVHHPDNIYLVHVDRKAPKDVHQTIQTLVGGYPQVHMMSSTNVVWRGWSMVSVQLQGIERLLELDDQWTHMINLSGMDFPLHPQDHIMSRLASERGKNFLEVAPLESLPAFKHEWIRNWYVEWGNQVRRLPFKRELPAGVIPYSGSMWCILNRPFCRHVLQKAHKHKRFFRWSNFPDEMFFQTVIMNDPWFRHTVIPDNMRFIKWQEGQRHPEILTSEDWEELRETSALFARKFDYTVDEAIMQKLVEQMEPSEAISLS